MESRRRVARLAWRTPGLWSLGLLGFLARGGLLVVLAPMFALPSPVGLSVLIGPDLVDANGLSARVAALLLEAGAVAAVMVTIALLLAAVADLDAFEGLLAAAGVATQPPAGWARARLVALLVVLQVIAVVPAAIAAVPAAASVVTVTRDEILLPSSQTAPLWVRVVEGASGALIAVALLLLLAGYVYGWISHELLGQRYGLLSRRGWQATLPGVVVMGLAEALRRPWRRAAMTAAAWLASFTTVALAVGAITLGWTAAQAAFLGPGAAGDGSGLAQVSAGLAIASATALLVSIVAAALVGLAATAAFRAAVLTQATLQRGRE